MDIITYDNDEFKSIDCIPEYADYPTIYVAKTPHVDETGRSFQVINTAWGHQKITHPIAGHEDRQGYLIACLPRIGNGNNRLVKVHRLVLLAWLGELPNNYQELQVNHLNENKSDNRLENLKLVTARENLIWGTRLKRIVDTMAKNGNTSPVIAINIKNRDKHRFISTHECARELGISQGNICGCLAGRHYSLKGYVFCREEEYSPTKIDEMIAAATRRKTKN